MWEHRKILRVYKKDPVFQINGVLQLDSIRLKEQGIKAVALDVDGVLTAYGEESVSLEIGNWLSQLVQVFGGNNVFILSNKPTANRIEYFSYNFRKIKSILPNNKKPYPDGIMEILQLKKINSKELLVIDDRLLTGILAAAIANASVLYVTKPLVCLTKRPIRELYFMLLRVLERLALT